MNLSMGCDHGGYALKEQLKTYLEGQGHTIVDCGTHSAESCDYPDFVKQYPSPKTLLPMRSPSAPRPPEKRPPRRRSPLRFPNLFGRLWRRRRPRLPKTPR